MYVLSCILNKLCYFYYFVLFSGVCVIIIGMQEAVKVQEHLFCAPNTCMLASRRRKGFVLKVKLFLCSSLVVCVSVHLRLYVCVFIIYDFKCSYFT